MSDKETEDLFKDYVPVTMEYDEKIDGGEEHLVRDKMLSEKERLKSIVNKRKEDHRGDRKVRR